MLRKDRKIIELYVTARTELGKKIAEAKLRESGHYLFG